MFKLTEEEVAFIKEHIKNAETVLKSDDLNDIIDALDNFMLYGGRINGDYNKGYNELGIKCCHIMDAIFARNTDDEGYQIE